MIRIACVDCGRVGTLEVHPQTAEVRCPTCTRLNEGPKAQATQELRKHLIAYPVPLTEIKHFYRVLIGIDDFQSLHEAVLDLRCVATLYDLGVKLEATNHSPARIEHRVRQALGDGALASATQHRLLSDLAGEQGLDERSEREWRVAHQLITRMVQSGEGTEAEPYLVVDLADEYLVLERLDRFSLACYTVDEGGRFYDVHECEDGGEAWFEVTAQVRAQQRLSRAKAS